MSPSARFHSRWRNPAIAGANRTDQSQLPTKPSGAVGFPAVQAPPVPKLPADILYDQLNNQVVSNTPTNSQEFPDSPTLTDFAADDFVVPSGQTWTITEVDAHGDYFGGGPADNFNVFFYQNNGSLPGTQVYTATAQSYVINNSVFQVTLAVPAVLTAGTYWVSVQAHMSSTNGRWFWSDRGVQSNSVAAWQNPGGGFGVCPTWGPRTVCVGTAIAPDQMFLLMGTIGGGTPSPTPSGTPSPTPTECPRPTPGSCTSYEAEDNTLTGSAFALSCPTCSGGEKVGYVGNNSGTLQFNAVGVVVPGNYTVTICYTNGDAVRYALLSVNGGPGMPVSFPSTGSFQTVGSIQTTVFLNTGCNTLEFYNPIVGSWAPDFDRIQFNCPTCTVSTPTPIPTPPPTPTPAPSATCSQLQQRLNRLERRQRRLERRHLSNRKLNKRIRRFRRQLQDQGCL